MDPHLKDLLGGCRAIYSETTVASGTTWGITRITSMVLRMASWGNASDLQFQYSLGMYPITSNSG